MKLTHTAEAFIGSGVLIIILGIIYSFIVQYPALFMFGWGCCDIYLGIYHRNDIFYKIER